MQSLGTAWECNVDGSSISKALWSFQLLGKTLPGLSCRIPHVLLLVCVFMCIAIIGLLGFPCGMTA